MKLINLLLIILISLVGLTGCVIVNIDKFDIKEDVECYWDNSYNEEIIICKRGMYFEMKDE